MNYWPLQDAKSKLSELVRRVIKDGPLGISVHGKKEVVVLSKKDYDRLAGKKPSFLSFMRSSPLVNVDLNLERDSSSSRDIDL